MVELVKFGGICQVGTDCSQGYDEQYASGEFASLSHSSIVIGKKASTQMASFIGHAL